MIRARIEFWWFVYRWSGRLWSRLCPDDKASYWLDWLPALTSRKFNNAEWDGRRKGTYQ